MLLCGSTSRAKVEGSQTTKLLPARPQEMTPSCCGSLTRSYVLDRNCGSCGPCSSASSGRELLRQQERRRRLDEVVVVVQRGVVRPLERRQQRLPSPSMADWCGAPIVPVLSALFNQRMDRVGVNLHYKEKLRSRRTMACGVQLRSKNACAILADEAVQLSSICERRCSICSSTARRSSSSASSATKQTSSASSATTPQLPPCSIRGRATKPIIDPYGPSIVDRALEAIIVRNLQETKSALQHSERRRRSDMLGAHKLLGRWVMAMCWRQRSCCGREARRAVGGGRVPSGAGEEEHGDVLGRTSTRRSWERRSTGRRWGQRSTGKRRGAEEQREALGCGGARESSGSA